nr:uncharacterized protein CI109_003128 [Kwoniella shandongensis]KAA5528596.1 hypothetical protein CI109_003128 [Kwoniella shandongensis]
MTYLLEPPRRAGFGPDRRDSKGLDVPRSPSPSPFCDLQGEKMETIHVDLGVEEEEDEEEREGLEVMLDFDSDIGDTAEEEEDLSEVVFGTDTDSGEENNARISISSLSSSTSSYINILPPNTPSTHTAEQYDIGSITPTAAITETETLEPSFVPTKPKRLLRHPPLPLSLCRTRLSVSFIHLASPSHEPPPRYHTRTSSSSSSSKTHRPRRYSDPTTYTHSNMSIVAPGQSSLDFGEDRESTWHGLRRALSLSSSSTSGSFSRQRRRGSRRQSWRVLLDAPDIVDNPKTKDSDFGDVRGNRSEYTVRGETIPSGPSSPCDTDRFSLLDLVLPFPRPPGTMSFRGERERERDEHTTITIQPPVTFALTEQDEEGLGDKDNIEQQKQQQILSTPLIPAHVDSSPTDPHFPSLTQSATSSGTQTPYCPPSPALTPSPHLSSADSPILATPCVLDSQVTHHQSEADSNTKDVCKDTQSQLSFNPLHTPGTSAPTPTGSVSPPKAGEPTYHPSTGTSPSSHSTRPLFIQSRRAPSHSTSTIALIPSAPQEDRTAVKSGANVDTSFNNDNLRSLSLEPKQDSETSMTPHDLVPADTEWTDHDNQDPRDAINSKNSPPAAHPSAPLASRTTSTQLANSISPPPSYIPWSATSATFTSRRSSKLTAVSGSSGSSLYSYSPTTDSSSFRDSTLRSYPSQWHLTDKTDISTVFEEENSVDFNLSEEKERKHSDFATEPLQPRYTKLGSVSSATTLVNRAPSVSTLNYFSRERASNSHSRAGTIISTRSSESGHSVKSIHPFASAVIRPASPPPAGNKRDFLSPQTTDRLSSSTVQTSRSSPNLADTYKMTEPPHQVALVSTADEVEDENTCPVCVESLSFTYRLPGEKPHIVPECGHALHEECFVTVYGDVPPEGSRKILGVCGVCRQPMKMAEGVSKRDKLAMLMGQPGQSSGPRSAAKSIASTRSSSGRGPTSPVAFDPNSDDPLEGPSTARTTNGDAPQAKVVVPSISVRSEFPCISRGHKKGKQVVTAMVTVEVPPAGNRGKYPPKPRSAEMTVSRSAESQLSLQLPPSPRSTSEPPAPPRITAPVVTPDPFAHVVTDLKHRVVDYKTSGLDTLGNLRLFDLLCVRKGQLIREFHVYLFQEALICVSEERKSGLRGIFSSAASVRSDNSGSSHHRGVLKLKGRIYIKHVRSVIDTSTAGELSLTISMQDETLDSFILTFRDRGSHETWRTTILRLQEEARGNQQSKAAKLMGPGAPSPAPLAPSQSFGDLTSPSSATYSSGTPFSSTFGPASPLPNSELTSGDLAYNQPLGPVHTPIDLVIVLSLPAPSSSTQLPLKVKLMKSSLQFVLALLGPRDRISLVTCEMGLNGIVRKTPFLSTTRYESRKRLEAFVETLGTGRKDKDDFEVSVGQDERLDVVTAVNVALDVVLQRKAKNPLSGMILISDTSDIIKRAQMDLVTARLDAANIPVQALGYGRSHDPSPLWMISNHTHGTYTFVKEWYHLRDSLAGVVGGLMSIAMNNMKLHLSCQDNAFRVTKVSGTTQAIVSQNGKTADIELRELRYGEIREILVELDLEGSEASGEQRYSGGSSRSDQSSGFNSGLPKQSSLNQPTAGLGIDTLSISEVNTLRDVVYEDTLIDEVPVVEVDCSFHDPGAGRSVARLAHPVLLTMTITPPSGGDTASSARPADPMIVRRRMELLASDMITRALLIASRKNFAHASRILRETKRIIETIVEGLRGHVGSATGGSKSKREAQTVFAMEGLGGTIFDLETLLEGLEEHKEMFERDHRNYSAQQAGVLRAQNSWTTRTPTERSYCTKEVQEVIRISGEWQGGNSGGRI